MLLILGALLLAIIWTRLEEMRMPVFTFIAMTLVMVWLGLWQMQVFTDKGNRGVEERAQQAPVLLADVLTPDGIDGDAYGKPV